MFSESAIKKIGRSETILILTGAGISAESGVPTFRGENGLWKKYKPKELATPDAFRNDPVLVWEWYRYRRDIIRSVEPNPGHLALAAMEETVPNLVLVTQNVDGLHARSGSKRILEVHGNIMRSRCSQCARTLPADEETWRNGVPVCECGGMMRPDVVWFGESLPRQVLKEAFTAAEECDVCLSIGTSALVQPAASIPWHAVQAGAYVLEINPESTPLTPHIQEFVKGKAGIVLPELLRQVREQQQKNPGR